MAAIEAGTRAVLSALNHLIASEPAARNQLAPHAGKTLKIALGDLPLPAFMLSVGSDGLLSAAEQPSATLALTLEPARAAQLIAQGRSPVGAAVITGDAEFAAAVAWLAGNLRWEFEEDLSKLTGDAIAHNAAKTLRLLSSTLQDSAIKTEAMIKRGLADDSSPLITHSQFSNLSTESRELRDGVARLEQRLGLLEQHTS